MEKAGAKDRLRDEMRRLRRGLSPEEKARSSRIVCARIIPAVVSKSLGDNSCARASRAHSARVIAVYLASPDEIDLSSAIEVLLARGFTVVAPRWNGTSYDLARLADLSSAGLRRGPMGILEPAVADLVTPREVGIWLVPGLAFTRDGGRLGYGGGWYDRFLAEASPTAVKLGIAYDFQILDRLPLEPHDIPLDGVLTATSSKSPYRIQPHLAARCANLPSRPPG